MTVLMQIGAVIAFWIWIAVIVFVALNMLSDQRKK